MTIQKTLHFRSPLFRDLLVAVVFMLIGYFLMPTHFLVDNKEFRGLMSGMALGFGFGWLIHTLRVAKAAGQINDQNQLNFNDNDKE